MDLADRREHYESEGLDVADVPADPLDLFETWYHDAEAAELWVQTAERLAAIKGETMRTGRVHVTDSRPTIPYSTNGFTVGIVPGCAPVRWKPT